MGADRAPARPRPSRVDIEAAADGIAELLGVDPEAVLIDPSVGIVLTPEQAFDLLDRAGGAS